MVIKTVNCPAQAEGFLPALAVARQFWSTATPAVAAAMPSIDGCRIGESGEESQNEGNEFGHFTRNERIGYVNIKTVVLLRRVSEISVLRGERLIRDGTRGGSLIVG